MDEQEILFNQVNKVIEALKKDTSYQKLSTVKQELRQNKNLLNKIEQVKILQQQYVKSNMQGNQEKTFLEKARQELEAIPLYQTYLELVLEFDSKLRTVEAMLDHFFRKYIDE